MDLKKYMEVNERKRKIPYSVPLPPEVEAELRALSETRKFRTREWVRDLILENLPKLRNQLKQA